MSSPESNHTRGRRPSPGGIGFEMSDMGLADLDEILAIEERSFVTPWSRKLFMEEYHSDRSRTFVARTAAGARQEIAGYLCAWFVEDEVHILNLACHPRFRRRKVATGLLEHCLAHAVTRGVQWAYLEVRRSNDQALSLYAKQGFKPVGVRRDYYTDTREDAIVMALEMKSSHP